MAAGAAEEARTGPAAAPVAAPAGVDRLRVAICQVNPTVGDLDGNVALAADALARAESAGADVAVPARTGHHRLPARGPGAAARLRRRQPGRTRPASPRRPAPARRWSASSTAGASLAGRCPTWPASRASATPSTRWRCAQTAKCAASTASATCPTRRVRRAAPLPARPHRTAPVQDRRRRGGSHRVRGRVGARWAGQRSGPRRRAVGG